MPRSVTTLKACDCRSRASMKVAFTLLASTMSFDRVDIELLPMMAISLTMERTFSTCAVACSAAWRSWSFATSPVSSTMRL